MITPYPLYIQLIGLYAWIFPSFKMIVKNDEGLNNQNRAKVG